MATTEEIERRVEENDAPRTARRSAAAKQIGELAQRRAAIAEQLADVERELGDVLVAASDVIDVNELSRFTDVPATELMRWSDGRRTTRGKRRKPAAGASIPKTDTNRGPSAAKTLAVDQAPGSPEAAVPLTEVDAPVRGTAAGR
jgi:hypothetical protein